MKQNNYVVLESKCSVHPTYADLATTSEHQRQVQTFFVQELTAEALGHLAEFREKRGFFVILFQKNFEDPYAFWKSAKVHYPEISSLALKLLGIPASTAAIERLFSQWSFVHNKLRNRLKFDVSKKLIHVYITPSNSRM
jgi:hypothetical protein